MKTTNWTQATINLYEAIAGVLSANNASLNAWIETQKNGEQDFPIRIKNPALDNPFNWDMAYGVPSRNEDEHFFNDTEKDLTENWTACFGTEKAIQDYQQKGKLSKAMSEGAGICHPVRKTDLEKLRPDLKGVNLWTTYWKPKKGVEYWINDESIKEVYVVCTNNEPLEKAKTLSTLKEFVNSIETL